MQYQLYVKISFPDPPFVILWHKYILHLLINVVTSGHILYSAATALTWLLRWGISIQLYLVREVVVLVMLHLLC